MRAPHYTPSGTPMFSELAGYEVQLDRVVADAGRLMAGLTDVQFNARPAPNRWSIAENIDHLRATGALYLTAIDDAIVYGQSRSLYGEGPFRYRMLERFMAWSMEPPVRLRLRGPRFLAPDPGQPLDAARDAFFDMQEQIRARIGRANGLDLARVRLRSPVAARIVISLGKAFGIVLAHERRHLWQAKEARRRLGS